MTTVKYLLNDMFEVSAAVEIGQDKGSQKGTETKHKDPTLLSRLRLEMMSSRNRRGECRARLTLFMKFAALNNWRDTCIWLFHVNTVFCLSQLKLLTDGKTALVLSEAGILLLQNLPDIRTCRIERKPTDMGSTEWTIHVEEISGELILLLWQIDNLTLSNTCVVVCIDVGSIGREITTPFIVSAILRTKKAYQYSYSRVPTTNGI